MIPTADTFHALARSSPWRWTTLHFTHRDARGSVEAWVRRPGALLVRDRDGALHRESGLPYSKSVLGADGGEVRTVLPHEVQPPRRPDGLVAERPSESEVDYDDPMWQNFAWVAMLDPVELSHHVRVEDPREDEVSGRPAWRAFLVPETGYLPRCGGNCCELLWSEAGLLADFADDPSRVPESWRGRHYPEGYDVALDVGTGVVVRCHPVGGDEAAPWLENDLLEVDADLDHLFA
ncbi:hypothetical protein GCM10009844_03540 [Nocardioides koreensis]|uniref:DUF4241 domain-containing protein n=1 Tax=Nocardioides koreensis TaxID=433651 RepID=A0ABP5KSU2_9ACTN